MVGFNGDFWNPQSVAIPVVFLNPILVQNSCQKAPIKIFGKIAIFGQIHLIQLGVAGYWVDQFGRGLRQKIQLYICFINSQKKIVFEDSNLLAWGGRSNPLRYWVLSFTFKLKTKNIYPHFLLYFIFSFAQLFYFQLNWK